MALLNSPNTTPPDGFAYYQFETQTRIEGDFLEELIDRVIAHRQWKGLFPIDRYSVGLEIQRQICSSMPEGICREEAGEKYAPLKDQSRSLTFEKILSFSSSLLEWLSSGAKFVPEEVSVPRGTICLGCKFNHPMPACACTPLWAMLNALIPQKRKRANLHICGICGCALQVKVLAPDEVVRESNAGRNFTYPAYCWQLPLNG